eukprot:scaffold742_cov77-Skeletonema_menzelii.AAC.1
MVSFAPYLFAAQNGSPLRGTPALAKMRGFLVFRPNLRNRCLLRSPSKQSIMPIRYAPPALSQPFNHADRQHHEELSQPLIQSWMAELRWQATCRCLQSS